MTHPGGGSGGTGPVGPAGPRPRDLVTFSYGDRPVRTVVVGGEPWFVAADVCAVLGIANVGNALARLDDDEKDSIRLADGTPGNPNKAIVNEPGLYSLILRSDKPEAKAFKRWVTHEVLPAIRRTGRYEVQPAYRLPQSYAEALRELAATVEEKERIAAELEQAAPKAHSWDVLASAHGDYDVAHAAQILSRDPAISTGQRRLFAYLAEIGWIRRDPTTGRWRAYQRAIDARWLSEIPQHHYDRETGELVLDPPQVRVTVKGLHRLHRLLAGTAPLQIEPAEHPTLPTR